ncbi:MAG TPA: DCC1-like thiol-disulfide oxidoreductase family protein [Gemmatimonadaceae bacterium]|nr:DCC1-like thiol-disulfide oxidoreductase family protein [Gemmatimonadaceae bacterium]
MTPRGDADAVLLYDGRCGLCSRTVRFVLKHERAHSLRFAPLDGEFAAAMMARHPELTGVDSVVWVERTASNGERVLVRSAAALRVARYLGGPWRLLAVFRMVPDGWRDSVYDFVARHRHRLLPGTDRCPLPVSAQQDRFLD